uniref:Uncharacterized protein n=1 Tax=Anguilla anguilla TaxID=7936 RepID=A0A0E9XNN9_ANGAN
MTLHLNPVTATGTRSKRKIVFKRRGREIYCVISETHENEADHKL